MQRRKEIGRTAGLATTVAMLAVLAAVSGVDGCELRTGTRHTVAAVLDARSIRLDDGREILLADVRAPDTLDVAQPRAPEREAGTRIGQDRSESRWPLEQAVIDTLGALLVGRTVSLAFDGAGDTLLADRYGRLRAHVLVEDDTPADVMQNQMAAGGAAPVATSSESPDPPARSEPRWLQAQLLALGLVRIEVRPGESPCLGRLAAVERHARNQAIGLWRHPAYAARDAGRPFALLALAGTMQAVEGTVVSVTTTRSRSYLNFGPERRRDLAAIVPARLVRALQASGNDIKRLEGTRVRVVGWIELRGGPAIEILHAAQIESLPSVENPSATGLGTQTPGR